MKTYRLYLFPLLFAATLGCPWQALAIPNRTWVSPTGSDGNTSFQCAFATPCATFAAAIGVTPAGGEIDALGNGDYGPLVITQAITIDGRGFLVAMNTQVAGCALTSAICIKAGGSDTVTLRNLSINLSAATAGIYFQTGQYLRVEHVSIIGSPHMASGLVTIVGESSLNDVRIQGATESAGQGVLIEGSGVKLSIDNSFLTYNQYGLAVANGALAQVENCVFAFNATAAVSTSGGNASGGTVQLSNSTIADNTVGLQTTGAGASLVSFGNNAVFGNTSNGNPTGTTTQK